MKILNLIYILSLTLLICKCGEKKEKVDVKVEFCNDNTSISSNESGHKLFNYYCIECHNNLSEIKLDGDMNYSDKDLFVFLKNQGKSKELNKLHPIKLDSLSCLEIRQLNNFLKNRSVE
jgi:hypothetical protein